MSDSYAKSIKDKVQTVILLCFLIIFPIFALAFCFYSQTNLGFSEVLDKSFSVSIGFFGGAATLTASYIATLLFNDWREQHNKNIDVAFINQILRNFEDFDLMFSRQYIFFQDLFYEMQDSKVQLEVDRRKLVYEDLKAHLPELHISFLTLTRSIQTLAIINNNFIDTVDSLKVYKSAFRDFKQKVLDSGNQQTHPNILIIFHAFRDFQDSLVKLERNFIIKRTESLKEK